MKNGKTSSLGKRLLSYALPYRKSLGIALIGILLTTLTINSLPVLIEYAIDNCITNNEIPGAERIQKLGKVTALYLVLAVIGYSIRYGQSLVTSWVGQKIIYDLRMTVFKKILRLQQSYFDKVAVGNIMSRVTSDIERLQNFVTEGVVGTIADLFMLLGIMGFMIYISPTMAFILFGILPPLFFALAFVNKKLRNANRDIRSANALVSTVLQEDISGIETIQLFNREKRAVSEFDEKNQSLLKTHFEEVRWFSAYFPIIETGQSIAIMLIIGTCGWMLLNDSPVMTIGILGAFLAYVRDFFTPLSSLSEKAGAFQTAIASAERIFELLDTPETIQNPENPREIKDGKSVIRFENVWFAYIDEDWIIKDLSFEIQPDQIVAVVGATGAGKSTIINLIGRFYDIQRGRITIDGVDIREFDKYELRKRIGYVFQDPFLFAGSVADNLSLFNPEISRQEIEEAAKKVNAHNFIKAMPTGYDTILNERGAGLSLGQKQLLAMARAFIKNPNLLFIMDEATASIDTGTEHLIQSALDKIMVKRTSIVIAHRLSTIRHADKILVMRHGELIDSGTHDELMAKDTHYRQLYELMLLSD